MSGGNILFNLDLKQASLLAATTQSAEISELKRKLEQADEDLVLDNTRLDQAQGIRYILRLCLFMSVLSENSRAVMCVFV